MGAYILRRFATMIPTLLLVTMIVFGLGQITPGGPAEAMLGDQASPEAVAAMEERLGLDDPLHVQYVRWLAGIVRGDFGRSAFGNHPVSELILQRITPTVELAVLSMLISLTIGVTAGVITAVRHNTLIDALGSVIAILGISTPSFWLAIMLVLLFSIKFPLVPSLGYVSPFEDPLTNLKLMILPSVTLGVILAAVVTRMTRASMLDVLHQDYVRTARAKGLTERRVVFRHALGNAMIPVVTVVGLQLAGVLSGAVIVETIFVLPGAGQLLVSSIFTRDFPVVQGVVLVIALIFLLVNLLVDVLYAVLDPRIKLS